MALGSAMAADNCGGNIMTISFSDNVVGGGCAEEITIERTWTAIDSCGNMSTCLQTITLQDTTNPVITCPVDTTINCTEDTSPDILGSASGSDNCDNEVEISFSDNAIMGSCSGEFTIERTWTATDNCGNLTTCLQTIMVQDTTPPIITCPSDTIVSCSGDLSPIALGEPTAMSNCSSVQLNYSYNDIILPGNCPSEMTIERTWMISDTCGNSGSCLQVISVIDTTHPVITCPKDTIIDCTSGSTPNETGMATAIDDCNIEVTSLPYTDNVIQGACPSEVLIERSWTAMDSCGNSISCIQLITIQDTVAPTFDIAQNVVIPCGADHTDLTIAGNITNVFDGCGILDTNYVDDLSQIQTCNGNGSITRTWTVHDLCGNSTTKIQTITLADLNCLPCIDTIYVLPGDTCLDKETYELNEVERVEICDGGDDVLLIAGSDSCVSLILVTPEFAGTDTACIILCDSIQGLEVCDTTYIITTVRPQIDSLVIKVPYSEGQQGVRDTICVSQFLEFGDGYDDITLCGEADGFTEELYQDSCVIIETLPNQASIDTSCIIHCYDTAGQVICDTTVFVVIITPIPDTVVIHVTGGERAVVCLDQELQLGADFNSAEICDSSNVLGENLLSAENDTCIAINPSPNFGGIDTICVLHCYEALGCVVCDTTTIIAFVPPPVNTMYVLPGDTCLSKREYQLGEVERAFVCDSGDHVNLTLGPDSCFTTELKDPNFTGMDTLCLVHCDTISGYEFCDTTYVIVITCLPMSCRSFVNLSLDENCSVTFTPQIVVQPQIFPDNFYTVEIRDKFGNIHPPTFGPNDIGERFTVSVIFDFCGNSCWAEILVEDKFAPEVICHDDTMSCVEFMHLIDEPDVIEYCQDYTKHKVDEQITVRDCDPEFQKLVTQKWIAIDESGNVSDTCTQSIWISRFPLDSVDGPRRALELYCGSGYRKDANGYPHPEVTGVPTLYGYDLWPITDFFCNVGVTYKDDYLGKIGCEERIMRTWTVREWWCLEDDERYFNQFFTIIDDVGPEVILSNDTIYAKAGQRSCDAMVDMPVALVDDVCHDVDRVDMVYPGGFSGDQNGGKIVLPVGLNEVIYRVFDACYNETTDTVIVVVRDQVAPIAVCEQNTVVSLDNDGVVHVYAEVFDDGSFDECELKGMEVRRMTDNCNSGTDVWGDYVEFCCADIGQDIMVGFRVTDKSGNMGTCMVRVQVLDKLPPVYEGLPDITVDCRFDIDRTNMSVFGTYVYADSLREAIVIDAEYVAFSGPAIDGVVEDNCPPVMRDSVDFGGVDNCGLGRIYRYFWFYDLQGNQTHTDVQLIEIINNRPFDSTQIIWPVDIDTVNVCGASNLRPERLAEHQGFPRFIDEDECSLIGYDYHDELIDASIGSEACYKIIRSWTVIDWCQKTQSNVHKKWSYEQYIVVENTIAPEITSSCTDTVRCVYNIRCEPDEMGLIATATDDCTNAEDLYWTYKIDTLNDGTFDIVGHSNDASGVYPIGVHRIKWIVEDLCGNQDSCIYLFELRNCKAPTAYCKNGVIAELSGIDVDGDGTLDNEVAEIWASDFDENSGHPCGHEVVLSFSADTSDKLRVYDCDSLVPPIRDVTIWVTDKVTGQISRCRTFVNVQDNNTDNVCGNTLNSGVVSGLLQTEDKEMIKDVMVELMNSGQSGQMTDKQGHYEFQPMPFGGIYEVLPQRDGDDDNGVSTADLVTIQRYLLGKAPLNSPYRLIAADVNNSKSVTAADISELRKFILGVYGELPNNSSWRFVDESYDFPDPQNPWQEEFPEEYRIEPFVSDMEIDFVGVKIGDVTGDVDVSGSTQNAPRSVRKLKIEDGQIRSGNSYEVMITMDDLQNLMGYQFTLEWNVEYLELEEVVPNIAIGMGLQNFGMNNLGSGVLTTSWNKTEREVKSGEERLFLLKFRGKGNGRLSELMTVSDQITKRECYVGDDNTVEGLELEIVGGEENRYFALHQNEPNPWTTETYVSFHLPESQSARLTVYDENGREVYIIEGEYDRGYNEVQIGKGQIQGSGLLYYRLETRDHVATRKMIIIE
jgi:hypothetical protein